LSGLTTFAMGGAPARYFHPRNVSELRDALQSCRRLRLPWRVLGGGSNLLVADGPLPFGVIHVQAPDFDAIERVGPSSLQVGAGVATASLLAYCRETGLGGLEFLAGLPGTLGGAIASNAGAWGHEICEAVRGVGLIGPDGSRRWLPREEMDASYRCTRLSGAIVVEAELALQPRSPKLVAGLMAEHARARAARHPLRERSAGCVFRNPPGASAGKLLDLCGLKGLSAGGAEVSRRHANFIVNRGGAVADDVLRLVRIMRQAVRAEFGVELKLEVQRWPAQSRAARAA
jgi:UDP-N-acetylmuramate dehydrogenase